MQKIVRFFSVFLFLVFCWGVSSIAENITLTTYYPAPYGAYVELSANKLAVGENAAMPTDNGVIAFEGLASAPAGTEGSMYYDTASDEFKYYDGSSWQALGGGTYIVTTRMNRGLAGYPAPYAPNGWSIVEAWYCRFGEEDKDFMTQTLCSKN